MCWARRASVAVGHVVALGTCVQVLRPAARWDIAGVIYLFSCFERPDEQLKRDAVGVPILARRRGEANEAIAAREMRAAPDPMLPRAIQFLNEPIH